MTLGDLSPHFSRSEFDCPDGSRATPDRTLIASLEALRAIKRGAPLRIVSGYRSPAYNTQIGGARYSQHMYNRAADIPYGYAGVTDAKRAGFTGIGISHDGRFAVHVDVRPGPVVTWRY